MTIVRAVAAAAALATVGLWLMTRSLPDSSLEPTSPAFIAPTDHAPANPPQPPDPAEGQDTPATLKLRELTAMSETFRNTTFLIAIRDSGFVCNELLGVYGGINDAASWTATCSEMLAYTVSVGAAGALLVEPMLLHRDMAPGLPSIAPDGDRVVPLPPQPLER